MSSKGRWSTQVEGEPPTTLNAGDVLLVPAETIYAVRNVGTANAAELATYFRAPSSATSIRPACRTHSRALSRRSRSLPAETGRSKHAHVPRRIHRRQAKRNT